MFAKNSNRHRDTPANKNATTGRRLAAEWPELPRCAPRIPGREPEGVNLLWNLHHEEVRTGPKLVLTGTGRTTIAPRGGSPTKRPQSNTET